LPWASQLQRFRRNPQPILPILTQLKNDPSRYVQKSVANNLNDISKDHLQWVVDLAQQWHGQTPITDWIVRHACRTLLKQAEPQTRALLGFSI
jgi:3-methyladenine DNA glycosylase AlkC